MLYRFFTLVFLLGGAQAAFGAEITIPKPIPLGISPHSAAIGRQATIKLKASGGRAPYYYTLLRGPGTLDPRSGVFLSGNAPETSVVRVFDAVGARADSILMVRSSVLLVLPPRTELSAGAETRFAATGGSPPYTYSITFGGGTLDSQTGLYLTPHESTSVTIRVTDSASQSDEKQIQVSEPLTLSPDRVTLPLKGEVKFVAHGGIGPYVFGMESGLGAIHSDTGAFTSGEAPGLSTIRVTDSFGIHQQASIDVKALLDVYPASVRVFSGETILLRGLSGVPPYLFAVQSGGGSVDPKSGLFSAGQEPGHSTVRVTDSIENSAIADITVTGPILNAALSKKMASGYSHTCAITSGKVKCWGDNKYGQLGVEEITKSTTPVEVPGLEHDAISIVAGYFHTCALLTGGTVKCWGDNRTGQLGVTTAKLSAVPVGVGGFSGTVTAIAAGHFHNCAISGNSVLCWGENKYGQLGNHSKIQSSHPVLVRWLADGAEAVAAGMHHSCAIVKSKAYCWGNNDSGQLGNGGFKESLLPSEVQDNGVSFSTIEAGAYHTCAISAGSLWCWGGNGLQQLGKTRERNSAVPIKLDGFNGNVLTASLGYYHGCALLNSKSEVRCWGYNFYGQLGDGSTTARPLPVRPTILDPGAQSISAGWNHSCALVSNQPYCWGANPFGQIGVSVLQDQHEPILVKKF